MRSKLVIVTNGATGTQRNLISNAVKEADAAWWHWFQELWLVNDPQGREPAWWMAYLRSKASPFEGIVIKIEGATKFIGAARPRIHKGKSHDVDAIFEWLTTLRWNDPQ